MFMSAACRLPLIILFVYAFHLANGDSSDHVNRKVCQNAFTANKYGLLHKCISEWLRYPWVKYKNDNSINCGYCKFISSTLPAERMHLICLAHPQNHECSAVVKELLRLKSVTNRDDVFCNVLDVCKSHTYVKDFDFGSPICDDCKIIIKDIQILLLDNATIEAVTERLNYLCREFPNQIRGFCLDTMRTSVPAIIHMITDQLDPHTICSIVGLCNATSSDLTLADFMKPRTKNCHGKETFSWIRRPDIENNHKWTSYRSLLPPACSECSAVLSQIQSTISDPQIQALIKNMALHEICPHMTILEVPCKQAIVSHFNELMNTVSKLNVVEICELFGMCDKGKKSKSLKLQTPWICPLCEIVMHKLFDLIATNRTEESIIYTLDTLCEVLPKSYEYRCTQFVKQYGAEIVKAVIEGTAPKLICDAMGLCIISPQKSLTPVLEQKIGISECTACKFMVDLVYTNIRDNKTEDEIRNFLLDLCNLLPSDFSNRCVDSVNRHLTEVIRFVEENFTPEEVCQAIHLCPSTRSSSLSEQNLCLLGFSYWCRDRTTAKSCDAEKYCDSIGWNTFPLSNQNQGFKTPCEIMDLTAICANYEMAKKCDRTQDCVRQHLGLLANKFEVPARFLSSDQAYSVCETILTRWKMQWNLLGRPITEPDVCEPYSDKQLEECRLVLQSQDVLLEEAHSKEFNASEICRKTIPQVTSENSQQKLKVISGSERLLGLNPCSWGPAYFCKSEQVAKKCGIDFISLCVGRYVEIQSVANEHNKAELTKNCQLGPSFWCASLENAKSCGAHTEDYCRAHVWSNMHKKGGVS